MMCVRFSTTWKSSVNNSHWYYYEDQKRKFALFESRIQGCKCTVLSPLLKTNGLCYFLIFILYYSIVNKQCYVSGIQQTDSVMHVYVFFFFKFFPHSSYYRILSSIPFTVVLFGFSWLLESLSNLYRSYWPFVHLL